MNVQIERAEIGSGYAVRVGEVILTVTRTHAEARKWVSKKISWRESYGTGNNIKWGKNDTKRDNCER